MEYLLAGVLVLIFVFGFLRTKHLWIRQEIQVMIEEKD